MIALLLSAAIAFSVVVVVQIILMLVIYLLRYLAFRTRPLSFDLTERLDPKLLGVIAAAAHEILGAPVKIHQVHLHHDPTLEDWSRAGRVDIMRSHKLERK